MGLTIDSGVLCVVIGCSKRSGPDNEVSFYRIPAIINGKSAVEKELSKKRRNGFLATIILFYKVHYL